MALEMMDLGPEGPGKGNVDKLCVEVDRCVLLISIDVGISIRQPSPYSSKVSKGLFSNYIRVKCTRNQKQVHRKSPPKSESSKLISANQHRPRRGKGIDEEREN